MPLNLDHFLNVAANRTTSEIYVAGPDHQGRAQTRGTFRSWLVSVFKSDTTRNQRSDTAHAFIAALQEKVIAKTSGLANARQEIKAQYLEDTDQIVSSLRRLLDDQLNGRSALTANDIRKVTEFVDYSLEQADLEKNKLLNQLDREGAIEHLEGVADRFYGGNTVSEIRMANRGFRIAHRADQAPGPTSPAQILRGYLTGNPPAMDYDQKTALLNQLRADTQSIREITDIAIPLFERLSKGQSVEENRWTDQIEPGSEDARTYLGAFKALKDEYLGPLNTLEYFLKADLAELKRERFLDTKELHLNNGDTATSERSLREILDDFQDGKQLSEAEVSFIRKAQGSRDLLQVNQMRPGYQLFSSGGNPRGLMTDALDTVALVPNHVWQVVTGQKAPDRSRIVFDASEPNPWALAVNQQLIERGSEVQDFNTAMKGLAELLEYAVKSNGNLEVAQQLKDAEVPPPKSKHHWSQKAAPINQATLRNAQEINQLEKDTLPQRFARGLNRALNIDATATPSRVNQNSGKEYTHGYDDDIDAGRHEASNPVNPPDQTKQKPLNPGEAPRSILKKTLSESEQTKNVIQSYTQIYGMGSDFIATYAQAQNIDLGKFTPSHQELFSTIFLHQAKAIASDTPEKFNHEGMQKIAQRILTHVNGLNDEQANASLARFAQLRDAGTALLSSITTDAVGNLSQNRQALSQALINYIELVDSTEILSDLVSRKPDEAVGTDDRNMAKIAATDIAFSGVDKATLTKLFNAALEENSPLRSAYLAVGAHDNNPTTRNIDAFNAANIELTEGLNFVIQQVGEKAGFSKDTIQAATTDLMRTLQSANYGDFTGTTQNLGTLVLAPEAKEIFDALTPFIAQRAEYIRQIAEPADQPGP